jgi:hypothetical protein
MARPLRIEYEGAVYHVMARGNALAPILLDESDRRCGLAHASGRAGGAADHGGPIRTLGT